MSDKYIIKITRRLPESRGSESGLEDIHYYYGESLNGESLGGSDCEYSYRLSKLVNKTNAFTEQESKKIIEKVIRIYREYPKRNGKLVMIEILDAGTLKIVSLYGSGCTAEPEVITSRFDLMEME